MAAPNLHNEADRLKALSEYHLIDSAPEQAFDDLTTLAAQICGCPIALISCIAETWQWFKSRLGLELSEIRREESFCSHAIESPGELMIVADATLDARISENRFVCGEPNVRFYAGAPLLANSGHAIGSLCVFDRIPRRLADEQEAALRIIGRQVSYLLELRRVSQTLATVLGTAGSGSIVRSP
jgi:two-component system NtrC family sensor kinase